MAPDKLTFFVVVVAYFENLKTLTDSLKGLKSLCYLLNIILLQPLPRDTQKNLLTIYQKEL